MEDFLQKLNKYKLNKKSYNPLYVQISNFLEDLINERDIKANSKLPSEEVLANYYEVSRPSINKAYKVLIKKSLVYNQRGKGTFVLDRKINLPLLQEDISFGEALKNAKIDFSTELIEIKKILSNDIISNLLNIKKGAQIINIKKLRCIQHKPFFLSNSYLPSEYFPGLENEDLEKDSLFSILEKKYSTNIIKCTRYMKIIKASEDESFYLNIPIGDPLLHLEGVVFSSNDKKIEHYDIKLKGDIINFYTTLYNKRNKCDRS